MFALTTDTLGGAYYYTAVVEAEELCQVDKVFSGLSVFYVDALPHIV